MKTLHALLDHGLVRGDAIIDEVDDARAALRALEDGGIDLHAVLSDLQREGIKKFCASYDELLVAIDKKLSNELAGT